MGETELVDRGEQRAARVTRDDVIHRWTTRGASGRLEVDGLTAQLTAIIGTSTERRQYLRHMLSPRGADRCVYRCTFRLQFMHTFTSM